MYSYLGSVVAWFRRKPVIGRSIMHMVFVCYKQITCTPDLYDFKRNNKTCKRIPWTSSIQNGFTTLDSRKRIRYDTAKQ